MSFRRSLFGLLNLIGLIVIVSPSLHAATSIRQVRLIDSDWRFQIGDHPGAEARSFDDADWQRIGLPHSFGLPYFGASKFYVGYGWYRRHFQADRLYADRRTSLEFTTRVATPAFRSTSPMHWFREITSLPSV